MKMFNFTYGMVSLVAIVRKIEYTSTKITYTVEDHTGRMEAHYWIDEDSAKQPKVTQNAYAQILGSLRKVGDQNVVIIYDAEEVEKINEVTTHLLEILFCRFKAEQFTKTGGTLVKELAGMSSQNGDANGTVQPMDTTDQGGAVNPHGLQGKNALIYDVIAANNHLNKNSGISRTELYEKFPKIPANDIDTILEFLSNEGHTYSTVTSDHFRTVD